MTSQKKIRDYGVIVGEIPTGEKNSITDVKGLRVGNITLNKGDIKTGVTAILPHEGNIFREKVIASSHVINGFGKTMGTIQIEELGTIETPIILTNTLSIGVASDSLIDYMLKENEDICDKTGSVNPVVCECNDQYLNDIRGGHIKKEHILEAINQANYDFEEGAVGAGTGMSCYGLKGGIGSSSRVIELDDKPYTIGVLVLSNFGKKEDFLLNGIQVGKIISDIDKSKELEEDKGSIIIILATDIPMTERQLKRVSKRAIIGLSRTGSYIGNGSGEVVIGFTTANKVNHYEQNGIIEMKSFNENKIDTIFRAVGEATEEAILNSMICAETTIGKNGHTRYSLKEYIKYILK